MTCTNGHALIICIGNYQHSPRHNAQQEHKQGERMSDEQHISNPAANQGAQGVFQGNMNICTCDPLYLRRNTRFTRHFLSCVLHYDLHHFVRLNANYSMMGSG